MSIEKYSVKSALLEKEDEDTISRVISELKLSPEGSDNQPVAVVAQNLVTEVDKNLHPIRVPEKLVLPSVWRGPEQVVQSPPPKTL